MTLTRFALHDPIPALARLALTLILVVGVALPPAGPAAAAPADAQATAPAPAGGPPLNDPAGPPSQYMLARSDQLFITKTQQWPNTQGLATFDSTYTLKSDLSGVASSTPYTDTGMPTTDPSWPLLPVRGRFTDPLHEQVLLLDQSNNCSDSGSCTYTLLLGESAGSATGVPSWLNLVSGDAGGSPVAVAAGDLDGRIDDQGYAHDEAAVAFRGDDGTLQVHVVDYNVTSGQAVDTTPTGTLPSIGTSASGPGSIAVAVGDFDNDGQNEIAVLWQGQGCSAAAPACLSVPHLTMLRYGNDGQTQTVAVLGADLPLPSDLMTGSPATDMGFQAAVGNFDGQGTDELAFSFVGQDASLAVLGFTPLDETFSVNRFGRNPGGAGDFGGGSYCPDNDCNPIAVGSPPRLAAGLFWYDEDSGHGLGRRQLAMVALDNWQKGSGGVVNLQGYDVALDDPSTCAPGAVPPDAHRPAGNAGAAGQCLCRQTGIPILAHCLDGRRQFPGAQPEPEGSVADPVGARHRLLRTGGRIRQPAGVCVTGSGLPSFRRQAGPVQRRPVVRIRRCPAGDVAPITRL